MNDENKQSPETSAQEPERKEPAMESAPTKEPKDELASPEQPEKRSDGDARSGDPTLELVKMDSFVEGELPEPSPTSSEPTWHPPANRNKGKNSSNAKRCRKASIEPKKESGIIPAGISTRKSINTETASPRRPIKAIFGHLIRIPAETTMEELIKMGIDRIRVAKKGEPLPDNWFQANSPVRASEE